MFLNAVSLTLDPVRHRYHGTDAGAPTARGRVLDEGSEEAVGKLESDKAVGIGQHLCGGLLNLGLIEDSDILKCLHNIILTAWRQEVIQEEWKDAAIKVLLK